MSKPDSTDNPLSFVTTDELVEELVRRSEVVVVGYIAKSTTSHSRHRYDGSAIAALGMAQHVRNLIADDLLTAARAANTDASEDPE